MKCLPVHLLAAAAAIDGSSASERKRERERFFILHFRTKTMILYGMLNYVRYGCFVDVGRSCPATDGRASFYRRGSYYFEIFVFPNILNKLSTSCSFKANCMLSIYI